MKVLNPTSGFPAWGSDKGTESPGNLASMIWLQVFHRTGGNKDSSLGGHKQNFGHTKTQGRGAVSRHETEQKLPASVRGSPVGAWVSRDSPQWQAHWKVPLGINPFESESEVAQSCPTLCDPMDCSLPGSSVHGIFQAIVLEWIAISFSRGSSQPRDWTQISRIVDRCFTIWATREVLTL